jgi:divalent metal cation (Fe/Co/Zn/Cd) transporter
VGFGLDSVVEVSSAMVIVWVLNQHRTGAHSETVERRAVRLIAVVFFVVAAYVTYEATSSLAGIGSEPQHSTVGILLVAVSLVVMPSLAGAKRIVARRMGSVALRADAAQTQLCTYLSGAVLLGLAANAGLGWWWMDSLAGLVVAALAVHEGVQAWRSGDLCEC